MHSGLVRGSQGVKGEFKYSKMIEVPK